MRRTVALTLALLPAMWAGTEATAQRLPPAGPPGSLDGVVLSAGGAAVPGARVIWQASDGRNPHAVKTDADGRFHISKLRPGLYELRAQAKGQWSEWEHNVMVRSSRETSVTLRLSRPARRPANPPRIPPAKTPPKATQ